MSETLQTVILVTDRGSQTFLKVGDSATKMGNTIDQATTKASKSTDNLAKRQAAMGAAFTSAIGVLSIASRANAEAEASQARLETAIDNTGHSILEYQDQLDAASKKALQLGFDDEDAADSVATLTTVTGDAERAMSDLALAEDIARARNISLQAATKLVVAAENGRLGALARVGIVLDASATKEEALDALRGKFAGNAEAYAATEAGARDRLSNSIENQFEALGHLLGPSQQYIALLPGLSAGFTGVGAAVGALAPELTAATAASSALSLALGPVGLVIAAVGAGVAVYELSKYLKDDFKPSADQAESGLEALNTQLNAFVQAASPLSPLAKRTGDDFTYIKNAAANYEQQLHDISNAQEEAQQEYDTYRTIRAADTEGINKRRTALDSLNATLATLRQQQDLAAVSGKKLQDAELAAKNILGDSGPAAESFRNELQYLDNDVESGAITWAQYIDRVINLGGVLQDANIDMIRAAGGANALTGELNNAGLRMTGLAGSARVLGDQLENLDGQSLNAAKSLETSRDRTVHYNDAATGLVGSIQVLGDQFTDLDGDSINAATSITKGTEAMLAQAAAALAQAQSLGLLDTELERLIAAGVSTWAERTSQRVQGATEALGTAISVIIDGTKNLGSQSQGLNDWAVDLINVAGSYGKIDDLLASGQITLTTYNRAQDAGTRIIADNAAVQEDLLRIQAKQAPILADAADHQAKYIDQLADLPPLQQEVALGWQDVGEAQKAQNALQLASAEGASELGTAANLAATSAITAAARADPILSAMLEDMGLISVGADGTITMHFPDAETIQDAVDELTKSVDALTSAIGGIPPAHHTEITMSGTSAAEQAIYDYINTLAAIPTDKYTYVHTVQIVEGAGGEQRARGVQLGGIIPHAQTGIIPRDSGLVMVGEAGPELMRVPGGSMVYPHGASMEMAKRGGSSGDIHLHNSTINLYPPDQNVYHALRGQLYSGSR